MIHLPEIQTLTCIYLWQLVRKVLLSTQSTWRGGGGGGVSETFNKSWAILIVWDPNLHKHLFTYLQNDYWVKDRKDFEHLSRPVNSKDLNRSFRKINTRSEWNACISQANWVSRKNKSKSGIKIVEWNTREYVSAFTISEWPQLTRTGNKNDFLHLCPT